MESKQNFLIALIIFMQSTFLFAQSNSVQEWNQFRGPQRSGTIENYALPDQLPPGGLKLLWKKQIGESFSEIVVDESRFYTMFSEKIDSTSGTEYLGAFDEKTGEELWRLEVDSIFIDEGGFGDGPRSTPLIDGDFIYCLSSWGKLYACKKEDGKVLWKKDFVAEYQSTVPRWAFSTSPLIIGQSIILEAGGKDNKAFVAYNKRTGKTLWMKGNGLAAYNSPAFVEINDEKTILFANGKTLYAFDENGDTLWTHVMSVAGPTAMPVVFEKNKIFVSTLGRGYTIVEVKGKEVKEILKGTNLKNDFSSSLYYDGHIYGFHVAALQCISASTGEKKWTKRGHGKGSLILVGDKLLVLSDKGKLVQVKASPDAYTEMGGFQALEGKSWTAPSFANGKIYLRNLQEMACYSFL